MSIQDIHQNVLQDTVKHLYLSLKGISSYPSDHPASIQPIQKTYQLIRNLLETQNVFTTSIVNGTLVVEDTPIKGTYDFSSKFIQDLMKRNVSSFTFSKGLSQSELRTFLTIMTEQPEHLMERGGIATILEKEGISNIKVNEIKYEQVSQRGVEQETIEILDFLRGDAGTKSGSREDFLRILENYPERIADILKFAPENMEFPEYTYDLDDLTEARSGALGRIAQYVLENISGFEEFKDKLLPILSALDKEMLIHMKEDPVNLEMSKEEIIDSLIHEEFYDTVAERYVVDAIEEGRHDTDLLERFLPTKSERKEVLPLIKQKFNEYGKQEDYYKIDFDFFDEPWIELSDEIEVKEITGSKTQANYSSVKNNEETKKKIIDLISKGKSIEAKSIIDQFSRKLDDKSSEIRKNVAESFNGIISALDEFDKVKENFQELSNLFLNRLKKEDHVDTYLCLSENFQKVCMSQDKKESYYVDETLGYRLYSDDHIGKPELQEVLKTKKTNGKSMQYNFAALNYTSEHVLTHYLEDQYKGFPVINISDISSIPDHVISTIPIKYVKRYISLPFKVDDQRLFTAMQNPSNVNTINDLEFISGYSIIPFAAAEYYLVNAIERFYHTTVYGAEFDQTIQEINREEAELEYVEEAVEESTYMDELEGVQGPIVKLVNVILKEAVSKGASDIHIEPYEGDLRVRFRVDGSLIQMMSPPYKYKSGIASRIKIMSRLNISEKRLPQDGRFKIKINGKGIDFRVSTFPGTFGETVVLRLLDKSNLELELSQLGMRKDALKILMGSMYKSKGMILVTGPTGSGKTTTLYSVLQKLNDGSRNINTAEDPIEYNITGINQFQMNPKIGLSFATALRSFLRQDPDIIMVGEMRDLETAEIAVKAALTGHLVLSTLHTNSSFETITRLLEMGIEPFLVSSSVDLIIAQRLMRRICLACKEETDPPEMHLDYIKKVGAKNLPTRFYAGKGCSQCNYTGYRGRFAIYELLPMWHEIREMILKRESILKIQDKAKKMGVKTLQMNGISKIKSGITTIDEWMRVVA